MIKSYRNPSTPKGPTFPRLMVSNLESVVLFTAPTTGTVVSVGPMSRWEVGHHSTDWTGILDQTVWSDYKGSVTLENAP